MLGLGVPAARDLLAGVASNGFPRSLASAGARLSANHSNLVVES